LNVIARSVPWCAIQPRPPLARRSFDVQLAQMFTFFNEHPSELADLPALQAEHPGLMRLETWLRETGWKP
jgi:hypothetical protein